MCALYVFCVVLITLRTLEARLGEPACQLCDPAPDSELKERLSCAAQLWGENLLQNNCSLWLPSANHSHSPRKNSAECDSLSFVEEDGKVHRSMGDVSLRTFLGKFYNSPSLDSVPTHMYTAFNVTMTNIQWTQLRMRFKDIKRDRISFCRDFSISTTEPVPSNGTLFYDCIWSDDSFESQEYTFEYLASDGSSSYVGRYLFRVPSSNGKLSQSELFAYVDYSSLPALKLHVQMASDRFNVTPGDHNVTLYYDNGHNEVIAKAMKSFVVVGDMLVFEYDTDFRCGSYFFTAQLNHPDCAKELCYVSRTPTFVLKDDPSRRILLIAIVGFGGVVLAVISFAFFVWRQRRRILTECPPRVLMIYAPTTTKHVTAVVELAKYLINSCHVQALVDELHIPKSKTKDPFTWCNDAFSNCDYVMVVSSPYHQCNNYEGIYRNVDALGLRLLAEKLGERNSKVKCFSVLLPYCTVKDIPKEARNLRRFAITKDLNKMLAYLHTSSTSFYNRFCVQPMVYGGYSELATEGTALLKAMKAAGLELGKHECICNQADQEHPLLDEFVTVDISEKVSLPSREKRTVAMEMYPGLIDDLNLLGDEGGGWEKESVTGKGTKGKGAVNLDSLDL